MTCNSCPSNRILRLAPVGVVAGILVFALAGCAWWDRHDDGFRENDLSATARQARSQQGGDSSTGNGYWNFDEKGRQIERDLDIK